MNIFPRTLLTISLIAVSAHSFAADAPTAPTPVKAGNGTISFTGIINNDACSVENAGLHKTISVAMGEVSIKDMGTDSAPKGSGKMSAENFDMKISCNAGTKVSMIFQPTTGAGTGLWPGTKVLKLVDGMGAAKNIGIALMNSNGEQIDLSSPTAAKIENTLQDGSASLKFSAAYVTVGDVKSAVAGRGDAILPFTLQYE